MNSLMERWIQACRHELLDRTLIYNEVDLLDAVRERERHHNTHRPHRGIANARPWGLCPTRLPSRRPSHGSASTDATVSADSSTNTIKQSDQHE